MPFSSPAPTTTVTVEVVPNVLGRAYTGGIGVAAGRPALESAAVVVVLPMFWPTVVVEPSSAAMTAG